MLYRKEGLPDEGELVICTVTKIQFNSVFVVLDEYEKSGMIHISEISPGRIRNIRDYVKEGKKIVCVVLRINIERGHIDLSLRRVNKVQHRNKMDQLKKEQKAEKIVELAAKEMKVDFKPFYGQIMEKVTEEYEYMADYFDEIVAGNAAIKTLKLPKETAAKLEELIIQRIKPPMVEIGGKFSITLFEADGVESIKSTLTKVEEIDKERIVLTYLGAGKYDLKITAADYKIAEDLLKKSTDTVTSSLGSLKGLVSFARSD